MSERLIYIDKHQQNKKLLRDTMFKNNRTVMEKYGET